jgi:membrane fusion protein (multidrug efflux system)
VSGATRLNAILVPQQAVLQGAKGHFVVLVDKENKAEIRGVAVGPWHGDDWFITGGLKAGDVVVTDGVVRLTPGAPVKVIAAPANKPTAGVVPITKPAADAAPVTKPTAVAVPVTKPAEGGTPAAVAPAPAATK